MPDLRGLSAREAVRVLTRLGLPAHVRGSGVVVAQKPAAGAAIDETAGCELWLDRTPSRSQSSPGRRPKTVRR